MVSRLHLAESRDTWRWNIGYEFCLQTKGGGQCEGKKFCREVVGIKKWHDWQLGKLLAAYDYMD